MEIVERPEIKTTMTLVQRPDLSNSRRVRLKVVHTLAGGLVLYCKELEFRDRIEEIVPVEIKLTKELDSRLVFLRGYRMARKER